MTLGDHWTGLTQRRLGSILILPRPESPCAAVNDKEECDADS